MRASECLEAAKTMSSSGGSCSTCAWPKGVNWPGRRPRGATTATGSCPMPRRISEYATETGGTAVSKMMRQAVSATPRSYGVGGKRGQTQTGPFETSVDESSHLRHGVDDSSHATSDKQLR